MIPVACRCRTVLLCALAVCLLSTTVWSADDPHKPANPKASAKAKAILKYLQGLESRTERRLLSGQFADYGERADLRLMDQIHDRTGHWPAIMGVDYAGPVGINYGPSNRAAIEYWKQGGLITVSDHL